MRHTRTGMAYAGALALALLAACSSTSTLYGSNREHLSAASKSIEKGEYEAARSQLEWLLLSTANEPTTYGAQRYYAAFLLTSLHLQAALEGPFLTEPQSTGRGVKQVPSSLSHLVVSTYDSAYATDWSALAASAPPTADGQALLPPELAAYGFANTQDFLDLNSLIVLGRLEFQDEVTRLLRTRPELLDLDQCTAMFASTQFPAAGQPWVLWAIFEHLRTRKEPLAYKFGVRARELGRDSDSAFPAALGDEIANWILNDSQFVFVSPGNQLFDPGVDFCTTSGVPNVDFGPVLRTEYTAP